MAATAAVVMDIGGNIAQDEITHGGRRLIFPAETSLQREIRT